jgi:hypothetical protein
MTPQQFLTDLRSRLVVVRDYRARFNVALAQDFNFIGFLRPDEYRLSELITLLLDPTGGHGQRSAFLKLFVERVAREEIPAAIALARAVNDGAEFHVALEESTRRNRRIDIVLSANSAAIGIENKPWAGPQEQQLGDYAKDLEKRYRVSALMYLSGDPTSPPEISLSVPDRQLLLDRHRYVEWTYHHDLAEWLNDCAKACDADKIRWLLRDFREYVLSNFVSL